MRPYSELTRRGKLLEVLRWLCVLPLALLANTALLQIVSAMFAAAHAGLLGWVACVVWLEWRTRRAAGTEEGG